MLVLGNGMCKLAKQFSMNDGPKLKVILWTKLCLFLLKHGKNLHTLMM